MNKDNRTSVNYAAIDIGSNAVRLLIKHIEETETTTRFSNILLLRVPLRLGFDVFEKNKITDKKAKDMIRLMKSFSYLMKIYNIKDYRACATSAMRDSKNGKEIIRKIAKHTGIDIKIIDGQEEARIIYNNHIETMENRNGNYMYIDVGGGSTEINLISKKELVFCRSYNIGTIRMLNDAVKEDEWEKLRQDMEGIAAQYQDIDIIGSGGNINRLYKIIRKNSKKTKFITVEALSRLQEELKQYTVEERMEKFNLKPDRADVIVPAADIFLTISGLVKSGRIYVPVIGLADGLIDGIYLRNKPQQTTDKMMQTTDADQQAASIKQD